MVSSDLFLNKDMAKTSKPKLYQQSTKQSFPPESAGRRMIANVPLASLESTIGDVERMLFATIRELEAINYVYIVDKNRRLKGVISIKDVFRMPKMTPVAKVMRRGLVSVRPRTDQESIALLALQHSLKDIPVVDKKNHLLGVVSSNTILNILHDEDIEDILRFAGIHRFKDPTISLDKASSSVLFRKRFLWLALGLLGGFVAAFIVENFETALKTHLMLAAFIPTIVYLADALGTQTETIFIRSLARNYRLNLKKYLWREARVGTLLALSLGAMIAVISLFWQKLFFLSVILGLSVLGTTLAAMTIAILLPWSLTKLNYDPALAAGPIGTIIRDILSILIYFSIAQAVMNMLAA